MALVAAGRVMSLGHNLWMAMTLALLISIVLLITVLMQSVAQGDDPMTVFQLDRGTAVGAVFRDRWTDAVVECGAEGKDDPPVRAGLRRCVYK